MKPELPIEVFVIPVPAGFSSRVAVMNRVTDLVQEVNAHMSRNGGPKIASIPKQAARFTDHVYWVMTTDDKRLGLVLAEPGDPPFPDGEGEAILAFGILVANSGSEWSGDNYRLRVERAADLACAYVAAGVPLDWAMAHEG